MKRFSPREFALLCSPLLIVGVVGWLLSKRKVTSPTPVKPLHLAFRVEKPTMLEAFGGADAALVVELQGHDADKLGFYRSDPWLEVQGAHGVLRSYESRGYSGVWTKVWKGNWNNSRFPVNAGIIPPGRLRFGFDAQMGLSNGTMPSATMPHLSGNWAINRALIHPVEFQKMARAPLIVLRRVKVTSAVGGQIVVECVFDLLAAGANAQTPTEFDFSGETRVGAITYSTSWSTSMSGTATRETPTRRVREVSLYIPPTKGKTLISRISGRVSANNRWPLAFQVEPFDLLKVKVGQTLKFKSWPVPIPATSK